MQSIYQTQRSNRGMILPTHTRQTRYLQQYSPYNEVPSTIVYQPYISQRMSICSTSPSTVNNSIVQQMAPPQQQQIVSSQSLLGKLRMATFKKFSSILEKGQKQIQALYEQFVKKVDKSQNNEGIKNNDNIPVLPNISEIQRDYSEIKIEIINSQDIIRKNIQQEVLQDSDKLQNPIIEKKQVPGVRKSSPEYLNKKRKSKIDLIDITRKKFQGQSKEKLILMKLANHQRLSHKEALLVLENFYGETIHQSEELANGEIRQLYEAFRKGQPYCEKDMKMNKLKGHQNLGRQSERSSKNFNKKSKKIKYLAQCSKSYQRKVANIGDVKSFLKITDIDFDLNSNISECDVPDDYIQQSLRKQSEHFQIGSSKEKIIQKTQEKEKSFKKQMLTSLENKLDENLNKQFYEEKESETQEIISPYKKQKKTDVQEDINTIKTKSNFQQQIVGVDNLDDSLNLTDPDIENKIIPKNNYSILNKISQKSSENIVINQQSSMMIESDNQVNSVEQKLLISTENSENQQEKKTNQNQKEELKTNQQQEVIVQGQQNIEEPIIQLNPFANVLSQNYENNPFANNNNPFANNITNIGSQSPQPNIVQQKIQQTPSPSKNLFQLIEQEDNNYQFNQQQKDQQQFSSSTNKSNNLFSKSITNQLFGNATSVFGNSQQIQQNQQPQPTVPQTPFYNNRSSNNANSLFQPQQSQQQQSQFEIFGNNNNNNNGNQFNTGNSAFQGVQNQYFNNQGGQSPSMLFSASQQQQSNGGNSNINTSLFGQSDQIQSGVNNRQSNNRKGKGKERAYN